MLLPAMIIVIGTFLTSIDLFEPSATRILDPSRVSTWPKSQILLFDGQVVKQNTSNVEVQTFIDNFPGQEYFNFSVKDTSVFASDSFSIFDDFLYWFG
jgi:hypothetical protein